VNESEKNLNEQQLLAQQNQVKLQVEKRGAEFTFKSICEIYDEKLETIIPEIIHQPISHISQITSLLSSGASNDLTQISELNLDVNLPKYQDLVNYLSLLEFVTLSGCLNRNLFEEKILNEIPNMIRLIKLPLTNVRHLTCRCLAAICKQEIIKAMSLLLEPIFDCLENSEFNLFSRQGAIELVYCVFEKLNEMIIPFTVRYLYLFTCIKIA